MHAPSFLYPWHGNMLSREIMLFMCGKKKKICCLDSKIFLASCVWNSQQCILQLPRIHFKHFWNPLSIIDKTKYSSVNPCTLTSNDKLAYINSMERIISMTKQMKNWCIWMIFWNLSFDHPWTNWETNGIYLIFKSNYLNPFLITISFLTNFFNNYLFS